MSASYADSTGRAVKSLPPITPSERGRCNLSEISQSSKLLPGSAAAPTLRTVKFLVAPSTVRMKAGEPPSFCRTATYWADGAGSRRDLDLNHLRSRLRTNALRQQIRPIGLNRDQSATSAAAIADVSVAMLRQRRTFADNWMTLDHPPPRQAG